MAAPVVSSAAVMLLARNPTLTPDQIKAILMKTASKQFPLYSTTVDPVSGQVYTSQSDIFTVGAGLLNLGAALAASTPPQGAAISPAAYWDDSASAVRLSLSPGIFGQPGYDAGLVWGTSQFVGGSSILFGGSAVWAASTNASTLFGARAECSLARSSGEPLTTAERRSSGVRPDLRSANRKRRPGAA